MPSYNAYMAGIICGYILIIGVNIILIHGSVKSNRFTIIGITKLLGFRWLFVPWLIVNMVLVVACACAALTLFIWFTFVTPVLLPAILSALPALAGALLLYWLVLVFHRQLTS